jgi:hypothetical protein
MNGLTPVYVRVGDGAPEVQVALVDLGSDPTPGVATMIVAAALRAVADDMERKAGY